MKKMKKFKNLENLPLIKKIRDDLAPAAAKFGEQRHIMSLRNSFSIFTAVTIVFAIAVVFITIIFGGWGSEKVSLLGQIANWSNGTEHVYANITNASLVDWHFIGNWKVVSEMATAFFGYISGMAMNYISFYIALLIGFFYAKQRNYSTPIIVAVVSLGAAIISTNGVGGAEGLFASIIMAMFASTIFVKFAEIERLKLKLPDSIPPIVAKSFEVIIPLLLTMGAVAGVNFIVGITYHYAVLNADGTKEFTYDEMHVQQFVFKILQSPFQNLASSSAGNLTILMIAVGVQNISWFFGIHPNATINPFVNPILVILWIGNLNGAHNVATGETVTAFCYIGGGSFLPPLIYALFLGRKSQSRYSEVAKYGIVPNIFEIGEPEIYGWPVFLNFKLFLPYIISGFTVPLIPWLLINQIHFCPPAVIPIPWTCPPLISGLLTTKFAWQSVVVTMLVFAWVFILWMPFMKSAHKKDVAEQALKNTVKVRA